MATWTIFIRFYSTDNIGSQIFKVILSPPSQISSITPHIVGVFERMKNLHPGGHKGRYVKCALFLLHFIEDAIHAGSMCSNNNGKV